MEKYVDIRCIRSFSNFILYYSGGEQWLGDHMGKITQTLSSNYEVGIYQLSLSTILYHHLILKYIMLSRPCDRLITKGLTIEGVF